MQSIHFLIWCNNVPPIITSAHNSAITHSIHRHYSQCHSPAVAGGQYKNLRAVVANCQSEQDATILNMLFMTQLNNQAGQVRCGGNVKGSGYKMCRICLKGDMKS